MWDWIKSAASGALKRGGEYMRHAGAIQQIMSAPDYPTGAAWLRQHIGTIDSRENYDIFRTVHWNMLQQAQMQLHQAQQNPSGTNFGGTVEDRIAQGMAEIRAGIHAGNSSHVFAAQQQLQSMQQIGLLAEQFWNERAAAPRTPPVDPSPLAASSSDPSPADRLSAFQRHVQEIMNASVAGDRGTRRQDPGPSDPADELSLMREQLQLDSRLTNAMMRVMPGMASEDVAGELTAITKGYESLLARAPSGGRLVEPSNLLKQLGMAQQYAGMTWESLRDDEAAVECYRRSVAFFEQGGWGEDARQIARKIGDVEAEIGDDVDSQIELVEDRLAEDGEPSVDRAELLIRLGELHVSAGDSFAGLEQLGEAEAMLENLGVEVPDAGRMAFDVLNTMSAILNQRPGETPSTELSTMRARAVYKRLYHALADAYREAADASGDDDYLDKADDYLARLEAMESKKGSEEFGDEMLALMQSKFKDML